MGLRVALIGALLVGLAADAGAEEAEAPPNVILVMADEIGRAHV